MTAGTLRALAAALALAAAACGRDADAPAPPAASGGGFHPFGAADDAAGRRVPLDGSAARMLLPGGWVTAARGSRLAHAELGCSVAVEELDRPFAAVTAAYEAGEWPPNRLAHATEVPARVPEFEHDGRPAFHLVWRWRQQPYSEWMLVTGDETGTLVVLASASNEDVRTCRDDMMAILRSVRWDRGREVDAFAGQTVRLDPPPGLPVAARADGRVVLGTPGEEQGPWLRVETFAPARAGGDLLEFARERLRLPQNVRSIEVREAREVERGGMPGWELDAEAIDKRTGEPMHVHLVALSDAPRDQVVVARATVSAALAAEWLPRIQRATSTLRREP